MSSIVHFELPAENADRAQQFWSSFLGWKFRGAEGGFEYYMTEGMEPVGAIYPAQSGERGPIVYFAVDDMDAALGRVGDLDGSDEHVGRPVEPTPRDLRRRLLQPVGKSLAQKTAALTREKGTKTRLPTSRIPFTVVAPGRG